jgi:hypothetical protein
MVSSFAVIVPEDILMENTKALVMCWHEKHYPATKIYTKLLARPRSMPAYSTVTNWIRALTRGEDIHGHASGGGHLPDDRVDTLVINALEESPFHSVRSLASIIKILQQQYGDICTPGDMLCEICTSFPTCYPCLKKGPESNRQLN